MNYIRKDVRDKFEDRKDQFSHRKNSNFTESGKEFTANYEIKDIRGI